MKTRLRTGWTQAPTIALLALLGLATSGCATSARTGPSVADATPPPIEISAARRVPAFDGRTGEPLSWPAILARLETADAIVVGEQHDDVMGHAVQTALTGDVIARRGGGAVAMEMFERHEQTLVDDWADGILGADELLEATGPGWNGGSTWQDTYLRIIEASRDAGGRVIAANAPRHYVSAMRRPEIGRDRIDALPAPRRGLVELPRAVDDEAYRIRFRDLMGGDPLPEGGVDPEGPDAPRWYRFFQAQRTWDATMADSVARGLRRGHPVVLLMIGQFHSDFDGATVLELRDRAPDATVATVTMQRGNGDALREEDRDRADIVFYTRPPEG